MNGSYKVLHLPGIPERDLLYAKAEKFLSPRLPKLETPTVKITNEKEFIEFKKSNPWFNPSPDGFWLDGNQGWMWGELGIWASTIVAWKTLLESDFDWVLIVEDDIEIGYLFWVRILECFRHLPSDWQIYSHYVPVDQREIYDELAHGICNEVICKSYQHYSMLCYAVNRKHVKELLDLTLSTPLTEPPDRHIYLNPKIRSYSILPNVSSGCSLSPIESSFRGRDVRKKVNQNI